MSYCLPFIMTGSTRWVVSSIGRSSWRQFSTLRGCIGRPRCAGHSLRGVALVGRGSPPRMSVVLPPTLWGVPLLARWLVVPRLAEVGDWVVPTDLVDRTKVVGSVGPGMVVVVAFPPSGVASSSSVVHGESRLLCWILGVCSFASRGLPSPPAFVSWLIGRSLLLVCVLPTLLRLVKDVVGVAAHRGCPSNVAHERVVVSVPSSVLRRRIGQGCSEIHWTPIVLGFLRM